MKTIKTTVIITLLSIGQLIFAQEKSYKETVVENPTAEQDLKVVSDYLDALVGNKMKNSILLIVIALFLIFTLQSCKQKDNTLPQEVENVVTKPEYFLLRPEVEKAYGYTHAVKIGNHIKVSGAVSMDDAGNPTAVGDLEQQMKNCYADLKKILNHYGCTFDDVVKEDIFTTDVAQMLEKSAYRAKIYTNGFPTGSWLEVKGLALPEFMVEIELEAYKSE